MTAIEPAGEKIVRNLKEAVERLHEDIERVELWADALGCFADRIPDYDPANGNLNKFALMPASSGQRKPVETTPRRSSGNGEPENRKGPDSEADRTSLDRANRRSEINSDPD